MSTKTLVDIHVRYHCYYLLSQFNFILACLRYHFRHCSFLRDFFFFFVVALPFDAC